MEANEPKPVKLRESSIKALTIDWDRLDYATDLALMSLTSHHPVSRALWNFGKENLRDEWIREGKLTA